MLSHEVPNEDYALPQTILRLTYMAVILRHRAQIDRVRDTLLHCFRLRHSATGTSCFCTTRHWFFLSFRRVGRACVQPVTDIVPLYTSKKMKLHGVGTIPLGFTAIAVATLCMGCAAPVRSCIQLSPGSLTVAAAAARACFYLAFSICFFAILRLIVIILDTGSSKRLKIGKAALPIEVLSHYVSLQVVSWCGGRPAAAQEVGILKCCQALSAAAQRPCVCAPLRSRHRGRCFKCRVYDGPLPGDELCGGVLGLRFDEALQPHREDGHVAAGSLSVGNGVQASGRVDVPSGNISVATYELQRSPDASAAAAKSTELVGFFVRAPQWFFFIFQGEKMKRSWILNNVSQFALVVLDARSCWHFL